MISFHIGIQKWQLLLQSPPTSAQLRLKTTVRSTDHPVSLKALPDDMLNDPSFNHSIVVIMFLCHFQHLQSPLWLWMLDFCESSWKACLFDDSSPSQGSSPQQQLEIMPVLVSSCLTTLSHAVQAVECCGMYPLFFPLPFRPLFVYHKTLSSNDFCYYVKTLVVLSQMQFFIFEK